MARDNASHLFYTTRQWHDFSQKVYLNATKCRLESFSSQGHRKKCVV